MEAIRSHNQVLEAVNDPNAQIFIDQTDEAVETAITLLVNSFKMPLIRRTKILEKYTKELVSFAVVK